MAKGRGGKPAVSKVMTNDGRKNGKARKKHPKTNRKTGKSCCGYSVKRTDRLGHDQGHRKLTVAA